MIFLHLIVVSIPVVHFFCISNPCLDHMNVVEENSREGIVLLAVLSMSAYKTKFSEKITFLNGY